MLYEKIKENKDKILSFATLFLIVLAAFYFVNNNSSEKVFNTKTINQKSSYYGSGSEIVNIPDQNLKNFLLENLKKKTIERRGVLKTYDDYVKPKNENDIYIRDMDRIREIELYSNLGISDLTGLQTASSMMILTIRNNNISNINALSSLNNLIGIDLGNNNITDISALSGLTRLSMINLAYNNISYIEPLRNLNDLSDLSLYNNNIEDISALRNLTNMSTLILSYNKINNIEPLSDMRELINLYIHSNEIPDFSYLGNLSKLKVLYAHSQRINARLNSYNQFKKIYTIQTLKDYKAINIDLSRETNGQLKEFGSGYYSKSYTLERGSFPLNILRGIDGKDPNNNGNWNSTLPLFKIYSTPYDGHSDIFKTSIPIGKPNQNDNVNRPESIIATLKNDKGLPEREITAVLNLDKTAYEVIENVEKFKNGDIVKYSVVPNTPIQGYKIIAGRYFYVGNKYNITIEKKWVNRRCIKTR